MRIRHTTEKQKIQLQMTPMIDIVFQLLVFFIMTFKIAALEGDFNINMPSAAPQDGVPDDDQLPPMTLRLTADATGELSGIQLNERPFTDFGELHRYIFSLVGADAPGDLREAAVIELDCDQNLRYRFVIDAVTAVSGRPTPDGDIIRLIEKVVFARPRG